MINLLLCVIYQLDVRPCSYNEITDHKYDIDNYVCILGLY